MSLGSDFVPFFKKVTCTDIYQKLSASGIAADVGALQQLPKVIGNQSLARELCLTARKFDSKEAIDCGFVNRTFDDKENMMSTCLEMAEAMGKAIFHFKISQLEGNNIKVS